MTFVLLSADLVVTLHDAVLNPVELAGLALDKSRDGALGRVENRLAYGMISDVFDLAAAYGIAIVQGHCFNDANKRTAFRAMNAVLALNGVQVRWSAESIGPVIIRAAQRLLDEGELALWLRQHC
ncbi:MAG: type II toxin-antitoxin system death-on-curing family toxin [Pseudorhodobacter sp.]|nr:type II toxin-antitoxin system death-on-curing family toxin [Pseudorhodobacter sp.]